MLVTVYRLREQGRPLSYDDALVRATYGNLVYGTWGNPEQHAKLFREDGAELQRLEHARVMRVRNGCLLFFGFQWAVSHPYPRQTWLCSLTPEEGTAALKKLRPPMTNPPFQLDKILTP